MYTCPGSLFDFVLLFYIPLEEPAEIPEASSMEVAETARNADFPTLKSCLISPLFILALFYVAILQLRMIFFLGTFNPWLEMLTECDQDTGLFVCLSVMHHIISIHTGIVLRGHLTTTHDILPRYLKSLAGNADRMWSRYTVVCLSWCLVCLPVCFCLFACFNLSFHAETHQAGLWKLKPIAYWLKGLRSW